jgi:hypothetical protein
MSSRIREHLRTNVVGYLALFLAVSGGTAYALGGSNTVFSDDIVDGEVLSADIRTNNVRADDIQGNAVSSSKLDSGAVQSVDVRDNSLTGTDIDEATLGTARVVARARGASDVPVPPSGSSPYPLTGGAWTQRADESDRELYGTVTYTQAGAPCNSSAGGFSLPVSSVVKFEIPGGQNLFAGVPTTADGTQTTRGFSISTDDFFEPGAPTSRTMTATVSLSPGGGPCDAGTFPPTINAVKIDVLGVS